MEEIKPMIEAVTKGVKAEIENMNDFYNAKPDWWQDSKEGEAYIEKLGTLTTVGVDLNSALEAFNNYLT